MPSDLEDEAWKMLPMSARAREFYENSFLPQYQELTRRVKQTPLAVLVWGPGRNGGDLFAKRVQIVNRLRDMGIAAIFSEEVDEDVPNAMESVRDRELLQAIAADFIIALYVSPGSVGEVHDMAGFTGDIASKMLVFLDEKHLSGYGASGALSELRALYGNVEPYRYPDDVRSCSLLGAIERRVVALRHAKWRRGLR